MKIAYYLRRFWAGLLIIIIAVTAAPSLAQGDPPASYRLDGLRHIYQTWNNCGAANLTMAMSYFGWGYDQELAAAWLKPNGEDKNVSPAQMVGYVNQQTEMPTIRALWRYGGTLDLLKEFLSAGFPVIIESGYDVEDKGWMGHYETVAAYDDPSQTVWVYDSYLGLGSGYGMEHSYAEFDQYWRHFNRAFIVLFPLEREEVVRSILGGYADPAYAAQQALDQALDEAALDQADKWAWFNAGTSAAKLGQYADAAIYYDDAFRHDLPYRMLWYQFGPYESYYNVGRYDTVLSMANNTEATTLYVEETNYWRGMVYAAQGKTQDAINEFNQALSFNRNFTDAQSAKTLVETGQFKAPV